MSAEAFHMPILSVDGREAPELPRWFEWVPTDLDRKRAEHNHGQSLEVLARRGGLAWCELLAVLLDRAIRFESPLQAHRGCVAALASRTAS